GPSATYNVPVAWRLRGPMDAAALTAALRDVVGRHEALRTTFPVVDGQPYQQVTPAARAVPEVTVVRAGESELAALTERAARYVFDLAAELPVRAWLFTLGPDDCVLVLLIHHIAGDGWSLGVMLRDLEEAYQARLAGSAPEWPALPVQYADYTLWQRDVLGDPADPDSLAHEQLTFWRAALDGAPAATRLPADRPRPAEPSHRGALVTARLSATAHKALAATTRAHRATFFMTARAALCAALGAAGAGPDVVVGTPVAGRPEEDLHDLVGFFVNSLALRADLSDDPDLGTLLDRVRGRDLAAMAHEDLPFDLLVEDLNPERSLGLHPVFHFMLNTQTDQDTTCTLGALSVTLDAADLATAQFDLGFNCAETYGPDGDPAGVLLGLQ
ncbi:condensation domain-containing protein, partial [Streptomyces rubiginosohelvolus]